MMKPKMKPRMSPKLWAVLLMTGNMAFTSVSQAQQWGTGMYGGQQACPYNYGAANGAVSEDDDVTELKELQRDLRTEKRDSERRLRDLDAKKEKYSTAITDGINGTWASRVMDHMENGYNCNCPQAQGPVDYGPPPVINERPPVEVYQPPVIQDEPPIIDQTPEPPPPAPRPKPVGPRPASDIFEPGKQDRMPASVGGDRAPAGELPRGEARYSAPPVSAGTSVQGNPYDQGFGGGGGGYQGSVSSMCGPQDQQSQSQAWKFVCRDGGGVSKDVCRNPHFKAADSKGQQLNDCVKAVDDYRKVTREADKLRNKISSLEDQISNIGVQIGELKRDRKRDGDLEASCPTGECYKRKGHSEAKSSNIWGTVLPLAAGVLGGLGAEYLGYTANKANNTNLNKLGWPTQPYQAGSYGFPFFQAGIYGAVAGASNGGFGCNGANPYGQMGPFGAQNPYGSQGGYGYGGAFGYPQGMIPGFPQMGGGMYQPGAGPWGAAGPWGNGYNPYGGAGGGFQGGFAGGIGFAAQGGLAGGGFQGGFAGGGFQGGLAGGVGFAVGLAGGGGLYGQPGLAGGLYGQPGLAGGLYGQPGLAGGIGLAGGGGLYGQPGLAGGLTSGFTSPYGVAGGFTGGGFLTPSPSMYGTQNGLYPQQAIQGQLQQYQMQVDMQRRASDNYTSQARTQQGLMTEYNSLLYRMQSLNGSGGYGGGYGGGGYGLGIGIGTQGYGLPASSGLGINIDASTLGVPGRTR